MDYTTWHNGIATPILVIATVKIGIGILIYLAVRQRYRAGVAQHSIRRGGEAACCGSCSDAQGIEGGALPIKPLRPFVFPTTMDRCSSSSRPRQAE